MARGFFVGSKLKFVVPGSKLPWFQYGDGHQPNSRVLYTHYKDPNTYEYELCDLDDCGPASSLDIYLDGLCMIILLFPETCYTRTVDLFDISTTLSL